jgi:hypothetical protein
MPLSEVSEAVQIMEELLINELPEHIFVLGVF